MKNTKELFGDCYIWGRKEISEIPFVKDEVFEKIAEKEIEKIFKF